MDGQVPNISDRIMNRILPLELLVGEGLLVVFQKRHFLIGMKILIPIIVIFHGLLDILVIAEADSQGPLAKPGASDDPTASASTETQDSPADT